MLTTASSTRAQFISPQWSRPTDLSSAAALRTTYQIFDLFQDDDGDPSNGIQMATPDAVNINPNGNASLEETSGQAFLTSSGNIYSPFAVIQMGVTVPTYSPASDTVTRFLVQLQTQGSELVATDPAIPTYDFGALRINGKPLEELTEFSYRELSRQNDTGVLVRHAFEFAVRSATDTSFDFTYLPLETSNSQQYVSIDTFSTVLGDFDFDGDRDANDIDLLLRADAGATPVAASLFDLDEDGLVSPTPNSPHSDSDRWVRALEATDYGDANLDGRIQFDDLLVLAQHYGAAGTWALGDFNGDDLVSFEDLLTLAQHYGLGTAAAVSFDVDWQLARSLVPEPVSGLALLMCTPLVRRRRAN